MDKFKIEPEDLERVRSARSVVEAELEVLTSYFYDWLTQQKEFAMFFGGSPDRLARVKRMQCSYWSSFLTANLDEEWADMRRHVGSVHAHIELPNDIYFAAMSKWSELLAECVRQKKAEIGDPGPVLTSMMKLFFLDLYLVIEEITRIHQQRISAGTNALMEMSTPVTPIWEGILLLPLVGIVDSVRTQDIMSKTLQKIADTRARVFVMDISGVGAMDTAVANQLIKITRATMLMGCETIISGVSPSIARTLVELGINIGEVRTTSTLRDSFEMALKSIGVNIQMLPH